MSFLVEIKEAVIKGDVNQVKEAAQKALDNGIDVQEVLNEGLIEGMNFIGARFKKNEIFMPEVLISARAMHAGMDVIKPLIAKAGLKDKGTVVIGTVKKDLHDIGKNLVIMMLEGAGYKVIDLGIDVPTEKFIAAIKEHKPVVIGLCALLTSTMAEMEKTVHDLQDYKDQVRIIVGGAPVTQEFADEIGADGFAPDAASAVDLVTELIS